ncbi:uncharacterized protein LOC127245418 isoform X2 [Andrographis paniculata]|uniref:uncharacterized protein LOC127245418 isoform X2 n=1 Tax=Andrographis paniculata TaxID=175694 RepID=UPI0021E91B30|nr:uncharacterized protein LOC127245418 isoform X2 [Andrographis paniculata]
MNHYAIQQNGFAACEEIWASAAAAGRSVEKKGTVVCPKPRRFGLNQTAFEQPSYGRILRWHVSHQQDDCDAKAGNELLDIILPKGGVDHHQVVAGSSPPFFSGSPPSRVSNPLIQDARFGDEKVSPVSPRAMAIPIPIPSSPRKGGGCVRGNFGNNPAVRIEGFDCLDRDRRNCSIPALA